MATKTKPRLTNKMRAFTKEYIKNGFNGTQAALKTYDTMDYNTAHSIAAENIQKPAIKQRIDEVLNEGIEDTEIRDTHKRNLLQDTNIPASNQALDMLYKIKGAYAPEKRISLNGTLTAEQIDNRIKEIQNELDIIEGAQADNKA